MEGKGKERKGRDAVPRSSTSCRCTALEHELLGPSSLRGSLQRAADAQAESGIVVPGVVPELSQESSYSTKSNLFRIGAPSGNGINLFTFTPLTYYNYLAAATTRRIHFSSPDVARI